MTLRLRARDVAEDAEPAEDPTVVVPEIRRYLRQRGRASARKIGLRLDSMGEPTDDELARAAARLAVVFVGLA